MSEPRGTSGTGNAADARLALAQALRDFIEPTERLIDELAAAVDVIVERIWARPDANNSISSSSSRLVALKWSFGFPRTSARSSALSSLNGSSSSQR
jgi:hypothetical protein